MSFTVYRSSAGSGKTFSLVREYLKMVLQHPAEFRHILAITFTHKAANEMKERVMRSLRELSATPGILASGSSKEMQASLIKATGYSPEEIARRAGEALSLILHHYSEFAIGTIDSFSHRIIRAFAHDFGLPVSFAVELDADELLATAVDLLLEQAGSDEGLTNLLVSFLESRMDEDKGWNIDTVLVEFARLLLDEEGVTEIRKLESLTMEDFRGISKKLFARIRATEKQCSELGERALNLIAEKGIQHSSFYFGQSGIPGYFTYLAAGRMDKLVPNSRAKSSLEEDRWTGPKAPAADRAAIEEIKPRLLEICAQASELREAHSDSYNLAKVLTKTIYPLAVLNEIGRVMDGFKRQHNLVHISEFNNRIARIVMCEPVPFIYERLGEKFHHLLVDEFQDTSRLQWLNFVPLMENALAGGYFNLVVGDGKQAIYRWRNGDVSQFTNLPALPGSEEHALIRQREALFVHYFNEERLTSNFRSFPEIIRFNNSFFRWLSTHLETGLQSVYKNLEQDPAGGKIGGFVRIDILDGKQGDRGYPDLTMNRIEEIIGNLLDAGYAKEDIAILCRTNQQAGRIARTLILRGIDVVSSESLLLSYSQEVLFITGLIRFLFEPADTINQAALICYLYNTGKLPQEGSELHTLLSELSVDRQPGAHLLNVLKRNGLEIAKDQWVTLPVYDLCEAIIRKTGLDKGADPYIQFFLDAVLSFVEKQSCSAAEFPDWWEKKRDALSIVVPEGVDAVRVMTIHKAKGLEFPVVIFPFADEALKNGKKYIWIDPPPGEKTGLKTAFIQVEKLLADTQFAELYREEQDKSKLDLINLLYVALTRPAEQLYILTSPPPANVEEMKSLPVFFSAYLQSEGLWQEGKGSYEFGRFSNSQRPSSGSTGLIRTLSTLPSTDWRKAIRIRQRAPEYWDIEDPSGRVDFGSRVHAIFSAITTSKDIESVMNQALLSGSVSRHEEKRIRKLVEEAIAHPSLSLYFSDEALIRNEPEIIEPKGESWRPDRVVTHHNETVVIDYKTGRKSPAHHRQVEQYGKLLQDMGYQQVRKLLVYLGERVEVEEV